MANRGNDLDVKKWDFQEPIPFGWHLVTMQEMKDNLDLVKRKIKSDGDKIIYLSNGSWDLQAWTAGSRHEMKMLLIGEAPKFKIFDRKNKLTDIGVGWRFACYIEVVENLITVTQMISNAALPIVCLSDGWVKGSGEISREEIPSIRNVLLIETPVNPNTARAFPANKPTNKAKRADNKNGNPRQRAFLPFLIQASFNKIVYECQFSTYCLPGGSSSASRRRQA